MSEKLGKSVKLGVITLAIMNVTAVVSLRGLPALAFANEQCSGSEATSIGYATVYPLTMFMRVLVA